MGLHSPTTASAGGYVYTQNITNLDIQRKIIHPIPLNIAFGGEFRLENYRQKSGEEVSWQNFGSLTQSGQPKEAGFQLFPGFRPENAISKYRFNNGLYLDLESALSSKLLLALAGRYELYSDFGGNFSWKLAGRYKVKPNFSLRGTMSTGFRAPSMPQIFSSSNSIQFINVGEELSGVHVAHFNNISPVTSQFGIMPLQAETSKNYSLGLAAQILDNLSLTVDAYLIKIRDRIVITGRFAAEDDVQFAEILDPISVSRAQFFTNAIDTKTQGLDFSLNYRRALNKGILHLYCIGNFTQTKIKEDASGKKIIRTSELLQNYQDILFNREEISRIEVAQPRNKIIVGLEFTHKKFHLLLRNTHFGEVQYIHPEDDDPDNWVLNTLNNEVSSRDQIFGGKWLTDLNMSYHFSNKFSLSLGANNIFDVFPDRHQHSANIGYGFFPYSRRVQQFGILGAFWFTQIKMKL
jgi:iron complex outermembrane receptor protein